MTSEQDQFLSQIWWFRLKHQKSANGCLAGASGVDADGTGMKCSE